MLIVGNAALLSGQSRHADCRHLPIVSSCLNRNPSKCAFAGSSPRHARRWLNHAIVTYAPVNSGLSATSNVVATDMSYFL